MLAVVAQHLRDVSVLRKLTFVATQLPRELPNFWGVAVEFATDGKVKQNSIDKSTAEALIDNIESLDQHALDTDQSLLQQLIGWTPLSGKPLGIPLISPERVCIVCGKALALRKDRPAKMVTYDDTLGTVPCTHYHKACTNKACTVTQYYGYYTTGSKSSRVIFNSNWKTLKYFVSSSLTAFSMDMLIRMDGQVVIGHLSYKQIADIFNYVHNSATGELMERHRLDRRRLESAHFQFAVLQVISWYPNEFDACDLPLHGDTDETLLCVTAKYHGVFMTKYAGHRCSKKGCGTTLVLDGNMKNRRDVCAAKEAGYAEFNGYPEKVQTGCPRTPQLKSRYCPLHLPTVFTPQGTDATESTSHQVAYITGKKTTRSKTFYEVARIGLESSKSTWEPASCLPSDLVTEYEKGIERELVEDIFSSGGETVHTFSSQSFTNRSKRRKVDLDLQDTSALEYVDELQDTLKCNTQKDRIKLNYHTAGILAGIWPCGIITMIGELFRSESMKQVYTFLHTFMHENKDTLSDLSIICYDDGCHLKRFAQGKRRGWTETAERIASCSIVIDKMHFKGHTDDWCHKNCNPYNLDDLKDVDTEICEQTFSWLSCFAHITRHMNREHFLFYILYLCDLHNQMH